MENECCLKMSSEKNAIDRPYSFKCNHDIASQNELLTMVYKDSREGRLDYCRVIQLKGFDL